MSAILEIAGRQFTWAEIDAIAKGEALVEHTETMSPKVKGEGVRVAALLARVTAPFPVTHVMLHDDGEYRACLTKKEAVESAVLAHRLDGAPLPDAMGGPLRLLVPTSANACLSVKRVTRIVLLDHAEPDTVPRPTTPLRKP